MNLPVEMARDMLVVLSLNEEDSLLSHASFAYRTSILCSAATLSSSSE